MSAHAIARALLGVTLGAQDLAAATDTTYKTTASHLRDLVKSGHVNAPQGRRRLYSLTEAGVKYALATPPNTGNRPRRGRGPDVVAQILAYVDEHPGATSQPIALALGVVSRDVARRLSDAMSRGFVVRSGSAPGFTYVITERGRHRAAGVVAPAVVDCADALPARAADVVRAEPFSTTEEVAAELGVDVTRAGQALRAAHIRGQVVGETVRHGGRCERVWRAVGIARVSA